MVAAPALPAAVPPHDEAIVAIETVIRQFLAAYSGEGPEGPQGPEGHAGRAGRARPKRLAANRNLWREVSSLTLLQLVAFVEQKFAIKVRPIDFAPQNFASVAAIARFVAVRRRPAADP